MAEGAILQANGNIAEQEVFMAAQESVKHGKHDRSQNAAMQGFGTGNTMSGYDKLPVASRKMQWALIRQTVSEM